MRQYRTRSRQNRAASGRGLLLIASALAALSLASAPQAAHAQSGGLLPIRLKVGVFLPNDGDTKNFAGSTHLTGEVDVSTPASATGQSFLSLGYSIGQRSGRTFTVVPVGLSSVTYLRNPASSLTGNLYYGGGVGAYFLHSSGGGTNAASATRYGAFFQVGYQTPTSFFIEGKYHLVSGSLNGMSPNGLTVFVGKRL